MAPSHPSSSVNPSSAVDIERQSHLPRISAPKLEKNIHVIAKYLLILAATIGLIAAVAALGVLSAPVSAAVLLVFLITYYSTRPVTLPFLQKEENKCLRKGLKISFYSVALILFVSLIILFIIFRTVDRLETKAIADLKIWKWLEIALVSCIFSGIWIIGRLLWSHILAEHGYMENLVSLVNASRWAVNTLCFFFGELLIIKIAPESRNKVVFYGIPIWIWIALIDLIICASLVITIVTESITLVLSYEQQWATVNSKEKPSIISKYLVYMIRQLGPSINFVLFMVLTLLTWVFYVNERLDLSGIDESSIEFLFYAKRTFIAVLIGSVLWVVKNFALSVWEAREVYQRFTYRLTITWKQMYLIISLAGLDEAKFVDWHIWDRLKVEDIDKIADGPYKKKLERRKQRRDRNAKGVIKQILNRITRQAITYEVLERMARHLIAAEEIWSMENEKAAAADQDAVQVLINQFCEKWNEVCVEDPKGLPATTGNDHSNKNEQPATTSEDDRRNKNKQAAMTEDEKAALEKAYVQEKMKKTATKKELQDKIVQAIKVKQERKEFKLADSDMEILYEQLKGVDLTREEVWLGDLEKWLRRACRSCKTLGRALAGNREVATYLDKVLIVAIMGVVLIMWIFLVDLGSTKAVAAIISSTAAAAFIFGETTKTLFQGMVFAFGVHPFDVGDICVINGTALEVKRIGIWKTVFLKEGCSDEEVIYPNSALSGSTIVKHNKTLDRRDSLEFTVANSTIENKNNEAIDKLRKKIKGYLKNNKEKFERKSSLVVVKELGDQVKIAVSFKHLMSFQDMTYLECMKKKNKSNSQLLEQIRVYVNEYDEDVQPPSEVKDNNVSVIPGKSSPPSESITSSH